MNIDTLSENIKNELTVILGELKIIEGRVILTEGGVVKLIKLIKSNTERIDQLEETVKNLPEQMDTKI